MSFSVSTQDIKWLKDSHRFTNYLSVASLYLKDNYWLTTPLESHHIKPRIIGHWGTVPGLTLLYSAINILIKNTSRPAIFVTGPGHGAPAILSHLFLEGSISSVYPEITYNKPGAEKLIHDFSWPGGFVSHTSPGLPGSIHEGGELGYSLGTAFGAVLDNPMLMAVCVIGDGEAETGALAASWHSNKFWNPVTDGFVLPILHLNGYKISNPTIFGTMSDQELRQYFEGLGYITLFVDHYTSVDIYTDLLQAVADAYAVLESTRTTWTAGEKPLIPVIIFRSKKGWTGPEFNKTKKLEDTNYSHGIPLQKPRTDNAELTILNTWLASYRPEDFFDEDGVIETEFLTGLPSDMLKMGANPVAGRYTIPELVMPMLKPTQYIRGVVEESKITALGELLTGIATLTPNKSIFRVLSPDESESNLLENMVSRLGKVYQWPVKKWDKHIGSSGKVMEILSEQTLQSWAVGYASTGRYSILISYEGFLPIIDSQIAQYLKFVTQAQTCSWRKPSPPMVYVATSTLWRQEHNGYTHQNPSLLNSLLAKQSPHVALHFPVDVHCMIVLAESVFKTRSQIHLITAGKTALPQWLTLSDARLQNQKGIMEWTWASTSESEYDIVLASMGDYQTVETLAGITIIKSFLPKAKLRFVNISTITARGFGPLGMELDSYGLTEMFGKDQHVVFNVCGYPVLIQQLVFGTSLATRSTVLGYQEKGSTTTPFDMQVLNGTSRYHVVMHVVRELATRGSVTQVDADRITGIMLARLEEHAHYIVTHGEDLPEILNWKWK